MTADSTTTPDLVASRIGLNAPRNTVPTLSQDDVRIQGRLGTGAFSTVFSVDVAAGLIADDQDAQSVASELTDDTFPNNSCSGRTTLVRSLSDSGSSRCPAGGRGRRRYALKRLRTDILVNRSTGEVAVEDILLEVELLSKLPSHPNIIKLAAMSHAFLEAPAEGFILLEKLEETLQYRLGRWENRARMQRKIAGVGFLDLAGRRNLELSEQVHRLRTTAVGVSRALQHLHSHNIIYRDLKPANIGFATDGTIRLFDFGMARSCSNTQSGRRLTGAAGTARYMAPEVALHEQYGLSADVYSFGMVLWQVCCLKKPFGQFSDVDEWFKAAVTLRKRPNLRSVASPAIRDLIQVCWDPDPEARPSFVLVTNQLESILKTRKAVSPL